MTLSLLVRYIGAWIVASVAIVTLVWALEHGNPPLLGLGLLLLLIPAVRTSR